MSNGELNNVWAVNAASVYERVGHRKDVWCESGLRSGEANVRASTAANMLATLGCKAVNNGVPKGKKFHCAGGDTHQS